jgi:predicted ATPase/class 3 adenylate cyclase/DNA-binding CsgD family transcriptional regulator
VVDDVRHGFGWPLFVEADVTQGEDRAFALPTGTVTFLLSDVEGSTRRWEQMPEAMTRAIPRHYELMDAAIAERGGVRPLEQGEGDSVVGAFSRASDAVAAAIDAQRAFAAEPWPDGCALRVRTAIHTGEAQLRDDRSYLGHALNRCARMRDAGHGGQVVLSAATAALVADHLPEGAMLADLGLRRLKDLGRPEHLWQVLHPDLPSEFPPLRSLDAFRHNLPVQLTPLIGRSTEIAEVRRILEEERLATLVGSAGVGKTRLALAVAAEDLEHFPGGVWWVELAPLADSTAVGRAVLAALGVRDVPDVPVPRQVATALGLEPSLVVLDNCEHVIGSSADLVAGLLAVCPSTTVLATSREPLGVPGEITWRVPSLRCPTLDRPVHLAALSQYEAVALFVERAHRARPSFVVTDANAPAIAEICHRLDGIPLAIELAAARCRQMSAERIAGELDDRFRLLTGGARTVMPRQQTLAASIDWSHDRLDERERIAFRRLAVFAGPFPLEAAEVVVAAAGDVESAAVFDLASRLVDKGLVVVEEAPHGELRYRLLESLRVYAVDRARVADELVTLRDAHAAWWADWIDPRGSMPTDDVIEQIQEFHANLKSALDWSAERPSVGLRLLAGLAIAWEDLGRAGDAMAASERLLTEENARRHSREWLAAAMATVELEFLARGAVEYGERLALIEAVATELGDEYYLGRARWRTEPLEARIAVRDMARERGDRYADTLLTITLAAEAAEDDPIAAGAQLAQADAVSAASGMRSMRDLACFAHAEAASARGDLAEAIELAATVVQSAAYTCCSGAIRVLSVAGLMSRDERALRLAVEAGDRALRRSPGLAPWSYTSRRRLELLEGQAAEVHPNVRDNGWTWPPSPGTLWLICREAVDAGAPEAAVEHARAWNRPDPQVRAVVFAIEAAVSGDERRWHDALALALERGFRLVAVDALEGLAAAAAHLESWTECLRLIGAAERLRGETGYQWRFAFEERAMALARSAAGEALADDARAVEAEGRGLEWRDAGAYARRARGERRRPRHGWASLTPTEEQVVALVAEGMTNARIAEQLLMGRATVKTHLESVFAKLGVHTRAELAGLAARRGPA